jgi:hypothetical protein
LTTAVRHNVAVKEADGRILFLRKLQAGGLEHSSAFTWRAWPACPIQRGAAAQRNHAQLPPA